jgi:hypothetical protein
MVEKPRFDEADSAVRWAALVMALTLASIGCAHPQRPESRIYVISEDASGVGSALGTGGSGFRNCDEEQNQCYEECWSADPLPYPHTKRDGWYRRHCTSECLKLYMECEKENEQKTREFTTGGSGALILAPLAL